MGGDKGYVTGVRSVTLESCLPMSDLDPAMTRRVDRATAYALAGAVVALLGAGACDRLIVNDFRGARIQLTLSGPTQTLRTPPGEHLEVWARDGDKVVRLLSGRASAGTAAEGCTGDQCLNKNGFAKTLHAYALVPAVDFGQACMIDEGGRLVWSNEARLYPEEEERSVTAEARVTRARAVKDRIRIASSILSVVSYGELPKVAAELERQPCARCVNMDTYLCQDGQCRLRKNLLLEYERTPCDKAGMCPNGYACTDDENGVGVCLAVADRRKIECDGRASATSYYFYAGNPLQLTAPRYGNFLGTIDYVSSVQLLGGFQIVANYSLRDLRELWVTQTAARVDTLDINEVDCRSKPDTCRGRVILSGTVVGRSERGVFYLNLTSPVPGVAGSASVLTRLDEDPVQF